MLVGMFVSMGRSRSVGILPIDEHACFERADAAAVHVSEVQLRAEVEGTDSIAQQVGRDAGIDQRAQQHISADASEALQISDSHPCLFL